MPKYDVTMYYHTVAKYQVEAESEDEAIEEALYLVQGEEDPKDFDLHCTHTFRYDLDPIVSKIT